MNIKNFTSLLCSLLIVANLSGQTVDSMIYKLNHLKGQQDRLPEFYKCNDSNRSSFAYGSINFCLSRGLSTSLKDSNYPIASVQIKDHRKTLDVYHPTIRYSSMFEIKLDKQGKIKNITTLTHCLESIAEAEIIEILLNTTWRPALKDLTPVASTFIIDIIYKSNLCHEEIWSKKKAELYRRFPTYRKELMTTYLNNDTMWDLEILQPMMEYADQVPLSKTFDTVESHCRSYVDSLNIVFAGLSKEVSNYACQKSYDITKQWDRQFYYFMDEILKKELSKNKK